MHDLANIASTGLVLFADLLVGIVAYRFVTGSINLSGLLSDKTSGELDPGRVQTLVVTLLLAGSLLSNLDEMRSTRSIALSSDWLLGVLGGSHGIYLVRKFWQSGIWQQWGER